MRIIADFHLHSAYSRATSREMHLPEMARWGRLKGLPSWGPATSPIRLIFKRSVPSWRKPERGCCALRVERPSDPLFILTAETSHIYTQGGKGRRVHMMIFAPGLAAAEKINLRLGRPGQREIRRPPYFWFFGQGSGQSGPGYRTRLSAGSGPCLDPLVLGLWFPIRF